MITNVTVYLDDNQLEFMDGALRCGTVVAEHENGEETFFHNLLDNAGYRSARELISEIVAILGIRPESVFLAA